MSAPRLLWEPPPELCERSNLTRYQRWLADVRDLRFEGYHDLWRWSVSDLEGFWGSLWEYFEVAGAYDRVLGRRELPGAEWFPGASVSYVEHVFRNRDPDAIAIVHASELRPQAELSWRELTELAGSIATGLQACGVGRGDRVAAYLPNIPEAAAALFACASLGAIWSSCSPDFGVRSVVDRFSQIEPKVLLAVDGYRYGGKDFDRSETVAALRAALPSVERTFVLPYLGDRGNWDELIGGGSLSPERLPFSHPLWVLYSSGTTGLPKPIVHSQGGILLEHLKKAHLHVDLHPGDRFFWFTTTGWMMWNFLLGGLLTEASVVLYDGSPAAPDLGRLWDLAAEAGITCFGTSAAFITSCLKAGVEPTGGRDLSRLRSVGSTGSPLSRDGFRWVYEHVGPETWLFSTSGGTDVCTAFVGGVPTLPVYEGELQARSLGAKLEAFDENGTAVIDEVGELVITEPLPSMPICFWGDEDGSRYREAYFDRYPGVWRHGDWIEITSRGTAVIYGRSDATINRGGVRIGTSELYRSVLSLPQIQDALVVDVPRPEADGVIVLFVVLTPGVELDDALRAELVARLRADTSPRHLPDEVIAVPEVPRTLSGKILEIPVKRILMGARPEEVASPDALQNPGSLRYFAELAQPPSAASRSSLEKP